MSSRKFSRGLRSSKSTPKRAISLEKWQDNCSSRTTEDSTESQKSPCAFVWGLRTWLKCRAMFLFALLHRYDPKEATKYKYYSAETVRKFFCAPKLTPLLLFKHSFFEYITPVFMRILWKRSKNMWKLLKSTAFYVCGLQMWLGHRTMLSFALLDRYDLKEACKHKHWGLITVEKLPRAPKLAQWCLFRPLFWRFLY